jgi:hypothetical protein
MFKFHPYLMAPKGIVFTLVRLDWIGINCGTDTEGSFVVERAHEIAEAVVNHLKFMTRYAVDLVFLTSKLSE